MITVVLMFALLATTYGISKHTLTYSSPYFLIGFRMILGGLLLLGFQLFSDRKNFYIKKRDLSTFLKGSIAVYLLFIPEIWALKRLTTTKVVTLYSITPFLTALLAYFLISEKLSFKKIAGMIVGVLGIIPLIITPNSPGGHATELFKISTAEIVLLVAICAASYGWFPVKRLLNRGYKASMINGTVMFIGGIGAMITSFIVDGLFVQRVTHILPFFCWALLLVLVGNVIYPNMYAWNLKRYSFTFLSFATFLSPIFGTFYGWYFFSEAVT